MDINIEPDFSALLALLNAHHVEYMIVGRDQLIKNKRATGRQRDLADLEMLEGE